MKKLLNIVFVAILCFSCIQSAAKTDVVRIPLTGVAVSTMDIAAKNSGHTAQKINATTSIPLRFFSEGFGAQVDWNENTKTATVKLGDKTVSITAGKATMTANGEEVALESPAVIKNGRTLVPMRDIAESLGKQVLWVDGGLIIAGPNPQTVHSHKWVGNMTEKAYGIR